MTDCYGDVQGARRSRARGAGAFAENVGLVPVSATNGTGTNLRGHGPRGDCPVFSVPLEIPQNAS